MASTISAGTTSGTAIAIAGDTSGALALQTNNGTTAVTVDTSQNVGIGTATPSTFGKLAVVNGTVGVANTGIDGTTGVCYAFQSPNYGTTYQNTIDGSVSSTYSASVIAFKLASGASATTESMRIQGSTLFIGATSSPTGTQRLVVTANGGAGSEPMLINELRTGSSTENYVRFYRNGSQVGTIQNTATATIYNTSSDYRLKEDIAPMTGALAKVQALKPVTYKWKLNGSDGQGFIAHELQTVVPDCVSGAKDAVDADGNPDYQGIDTSFLVATLTAAIQELNAKVEAQATTIAELQAKVG
jgi:hypothetical protein